MSKIVVNGQEVTEFWRYVIRFDYLDHKPILYQDGKRVTRPWSLEIVASREEDKEGASANTA